MKWLWNAAKLILEWVGVIPALKRIRIEFEIEFA